MINDAAVYAESRRVLAKLEAKQKDGTITPREQGRMGVIAAHILVWEWARDNAPAVEAIPTLVPVKPTHPKVIRFLDWYESNRWREPFVAAGWRAALWHWLDEPAEIDLDLWNAADEVFGDEADMVITDLGMWNRMMERREAA